MTTLTPMPRVPDLTGRTLQGRYELHSLIGEGAFGRVYRGRDRRLARGVAIKVIKPWWAEDPVWRRRFARETQLLARVNDPGIVQIYDVGEADEGPYCVAELVDGESLAARLRRGALEPSLAAALGEQLCGALGRAHAHGIVHRDVKPANILLAVDGALKVGDFGVAALTQTDLHGGSATIIGTPQYMSPEQARGERATPASDVYGAGVVLYEMLAGRPPFGGEAAVLVALHHLRDAPPPLPGEVPGPLRDVVERALAKDPAERFDDGTEMAAALAAVCAALAGTPVGISGAAVTVVQPRARNGEHATTPLRDDARPTDRLDAARVATPQVAAGALEHGAPTRVAPRRPAPPRRRRRVRATAAPVLAVLGGLAVVAALALLLTRPGQTTVPRLLGLRKATIAAEVGRDHLRAVFHTRFAAVERGTAFAQHPPAGSHVPAGTPIALMISAGPRPVAVPGVVGLDAGAAGTRLQASGLRDSIDTVPAPGVAAGTVTRESPPPAARAIPGSLVSLQVAETPRWRTLTTFSGGGDGQSVPFRILGSSWRAVTNMSYNGTCTFIIVCFGPHASVSRLDSGPAAGGFDLSDGSATKVFGSGPGTYQLGVSSGQDSANWSITVQDYY